MTRRPVARRCLATGRLFVPGQAARPRAATRAGRGQTGPTRGWQRGDIWVPKLPPSAPPPLPSACLSRASRALTVSFLQTITQKNKRGGPSQTSHCDLRLQVSGCSAGAGGSPPPGETVAQCTTCTHARTQGHTQPVPLSLLPPSPWVSCLPVSSTASVSSLKHPGSVGETIHQLGGSAHWPSTPPPRAPHAAASCDQGWAESLSGETQGGVSSGDSAQLCDRQQVPEDHCCVCEREPCFSR